MFHRLFEVSVSGQVILIVVMVSGCAVDVGGLFVKLRGNSVRFPAIIFRFAQKQFAGF